MTSRLSLLSFLLAAAIGCAVGTVNFPPIRATFGQDSGPGAGHYLVGALNPYMTTTPQLEFEVAAVPGTSPQTYTIKEHNPQDHYPPLYWSGYDNWDGDGASEPMDTWQFNQVNATHWTLWNQAAATNFGGNYGWGCSSATQYGPYAPQLCQSPQNWVLEGYYGCYQDMPTRDFSWEANAGSSLNTIENCRTHCGLFGYAYAGLQFGSQCFCGNNFGTYGSLADTACNMACTGNSAEMCGSAYSNSVYTAIKSRYIGCYVDAAARDLSDELMSSGTVTIETCMAGCKAANYQYAGLQFGAQCFCGNSYGKYGAAAATDCNMPCASDSTETCGAAWRNQIYNSGLGMTWMN